MANRQEVATVIDNMYDDYHPRYNQEGQIVDSDIGDAVIALMQDDVVRWRKRAADAESALFRVFGYMRGAVGRVFDGTGETLSLFEYEPQPRLYRMPYQVTVDGKSYRFRTQGEAWAVAGDARADEPDARVSVSERDADGDWIRL